MDVLGEFIEDCCNLTPQATSTKKDLYDHYESWANANGEKPISKRQFGSLLSERGIDEYRTGQVRAWMGIEIQ
jgi:putative DNA primase/helicase